MARSTTTFVVCTDNLEGCDFLEQVAVVLARTINDRDPRESIPVTSGSITQVAGGGRITVASA